tara:strand:- start:664 stop:1131 length:468 start_codon:yes stop_codon:yes gene_type:complete
MSDAKKKAGEGGRPTKYKPEYDEQARKLCLLGAIDTELADFFNVVESTIHKWKLEFPSFSESLNKGKLIANANVAAALYGRAIGYDYEEVKTETSADGKKVTVTTKKQASDTTACIFFLKNRDPNRWREKQEIDQQTTIKVDETLSEKLNGGSKR